jgi:hypothetical protein
MAVRYQLADYKTGDQIVDLPVMEGASWAAMLNKPDSLSASIDMRDPDVQALDIPSATEPKKTILTASTEDGTVLAWGVISDRTWDDDKRQLDIEASGGGQWFRQRIIAPPGAASGNLIDGSGAVVTTYDTTINDVTLGSIGVALVAQALTWPGAPTVYILPSAVPDVGRTSGTYRLVDYKRVGEALDDLTKRVDGPDFAFEARLDSTLIGFEYLMRAGNPFLGRYVGDWVVGAPESPVTNLKVTDDGAALATHIWMQAGKTDSKVIVARAQNAALIAAGYPTLDLVDTTHGDVTLQATLDAYATEHAVQSRRPFRDVGFDVKGNAPGMALGTYRPGDWAALTIGPDNLYLAEGQIPIRITSISGDETGDTIKIGCEIGSMP